MSGDRVAQAAFTLAALACIFGCWVSIGTSFKERPDLGMQAGIIMALLAIASSKGRT